MYKTKSIYEVSIWLDNICDDEIHLTDHELSNHLEYVDDYCGGNNPDNGVFFISHSRSSKLVKRRVEKYCKIHKMDISEYNGPLPYRFYKINITDINIERRKKLNKIIKKQKKNKFISFFKKIKLF